MYAPDPVTTILHPCEIVVQLLEEIPQPRLEAVPTTPTSPSTTGGGDENPTQKKFFSEVKSFKNF